MSKLSLAPLGLALSKGRMSCLTAGRSDLIIIAANLSLIFFFSLLILSAVAETAVKGGSLGLPPALRQR